MTSLIVLDTNVIVSAAIRRDAPPGQVVQRVLTQEAVAVTCPRIVSEYRAVMARPKLRRLGLPPLWLDVLLVLAHHRLRDPPAWQLTGPDPDDLVFLALAKATGAAVITGNMSDFPSRIRQGVEVLTPADYLAGTPLIP